MNSGINRRIAWHEQQIRILQRQRDAQPVPVTPLVPPPSPWPLCVTCRRPIAYCRWEGRLYCLLDLPVEKPYTLCPKGEDGIRDVIKEPTEVYLARNPFRAAGVSSGIEKPHG